MRKLSFGAIVITMLIMLPTETFGQTVNAEYLKPNITSNSNYDYLKLGTSASFYAGLGINKVNTFLGNGNDLAFFTYGNRDMTFWTGTGNVIVFPTDGGKMGIGTQNPTSKLTVNGKIDAEEIEVKNVGADFVFESDYQLRSLEELERYVKKYRHLPEIAPAVETETGVELGAFTEKLLQKIEELTLYTIEQQKAIQALENKLETLIQKQ